MRSLDPVPEGQAVDQIEALHWAPKASDAQLYLMHRLVRDRLARAESERARILAAVEEATEDDLRPMLRRAQEQLEDPKRIGDAVIRRFSQATNPSREIRRRRTCE